MSAPGAIAPPVARGLVAEPAPDGPRPSPTPLAGVAVRLVAFAALGAWGARHWSALVSPAAAGRMTLALALAAGVALGLEACRRLDAGRRVAAGAIVVGAGVLALALCAGVPASLLAPWSWPDLGAGLAQGAAALFGTRIPYGGADPWPRVVVVGAGALLLIAAALLAFWPGWVRGRGRGAAAGALALLYAVPAVQLTAPAQYARGCLFTALLAAFLWLDRVARADARVAGAALAAAIALGGLLAPRIDASRPWVDYEAIAESLGSHRGVSFDFDHRYRPLRWPREGRELFRVRARERAYWKTVNLDVFDGIRWRRGRDRFGAALSDELPPGYERRAGWNQRVTVTIRGLRSGDLVGAGTTLSVERPPSAAVAAPSPGTFTVERALTRGDSYSALVYAPRPAAEELAAAGTGYPQLAGRYLELTVPAAGGGPGARVAFPAWGSAAGPTLATGDSAGSADALLRDSGYSGAWALSRRLASASASPYDYVRAVMVHLSRGYAYTEAPSLHRVPLEAFLTRDRAGYCQHFSGAMALLLRMGGVPARVAAGFAPGSLNPRRRDWVVRDLDAHSWVEAYFPGLGWVTFDPTPGASPARSQLVYRFTGSVGSETPDRALAGGDRPRADRPAPGAGTGGGRSGWGWVAVLVAAALSLAGGAWVLRRRAAGAPAGDPWVAELERALRRTGHPAAPSTTLRALEGRWGGGAAGYLRALRSARYGAGGPAPTPAQRRGLRRALAAGDGAVGRLRALWALPPRLRHKAAVASEPDAEPFSRPRGRF